jgi:hypothetical protein
LRRSVGAWPKEPPESNCGGLGADPVGRSGRGAPLRAAPVPVFSGGVLLERYVFYDAALGFGAELIDGTVLIADDQRRPSDCENGVSAEAV